MRPLFVDFPKDSAAWQVEDQFMFGPDLLVAPVLQMGLRSRPVYLPLGATWCEVWTGTEHKGGTTVTATAPLEHIPVYVRVGADAKLNGVFG